MVDSYPYEMDANKILKNHKLQFSGSHLDFYMELVKKPDSGDFIHHYLSKLEFPFTPEAAFLYLMNLNKKKFEDLDNNVDDY